MTEATLDRVLKQIVTGAVLGIVFGATIGMCMRFGEDAYNRYKLEQAIEKSRADMELESARIHACLEKEAKENNGVAHLENCIGQDKDK